jgi:15-cis-phytoene synthase
MVHFPSSNWQSELIELAHQALCSVDIEDCVSSYDPLLIDNAYQQCQQITKDHSRTFYLAANLMPMEKRRAIYALYSFCRVCDDIVDKTQGENAVNELNEWRLRLNDCVKIDQDTVAIAWADTRYKQKIPWRFAEQLINGLSQDFTQKRYLSFSQLANYCYGAASTVGLMSMHIVGYTGPEAIPYAVNLGVALQLTNILRDVGEDMRSGRIYLPQQELDAFDIREDDLLHGEVNQKWREFMQFQIERVRQLYLEALPGISYLDPDGRFSIAAAAELYRLILTKIEENEYDVFSRRASVNSWGKINQLPGIWFRSKFNRYKFPGHSYQTQETANSKLA